MGSEKVMSIVSRFGSGDISRSRAIEELDDSLAELGDLSDENKEQLVRLIESVDPSDDVYKFVQKASDILSQSPTVVRDSKE